MVANANVLFTSDLLNSPRPKRQSSFSSTHSRDSCAKVQAQVQVDSPFKKRVRFLCTDDLDLSESISEGAFGQEGIIKERVVVFEKVDPVHHSDIWYTGDEIAGFRTDIRRIASSFVQDYPIYGVLLEYVLQNGHTIESEDIDIDRMRARRRRKNPCHFSVQWLSLSDNFEDDRYDEDEEAHDRFESCTDDDAADDADFFPCMRGLENRVIPAFRQCRRWAVTQVLQLQQELKSRSYEQVSTGLRIQSLQCTKKSCCFAQHQGILDAREADKIHGLALN